MKGVKNFSHYRRYFRVTALLFMNMVRKRVFTFRRVVHFIKAQLFYLFRLKTVPPLPSSLMVDVSSFCNLACLRCRNEEGEISDRVKLFTGRGDVSEPEKFRKVPLGNLELENFKKVVGELKDQLMLKRLHVI